MITVRVEPYFRVAEVIGKPRLDMEVEEGTTLKGLLAQLPEACGSELRETVVDGKTGEIKPHFMILVNGQWVFQSGEGSGTILKDGDIVSILVPFRGG